MGWVRIDDAFYDHPAHAALGLDAWGLWVWSLAWSNRNLSDGVIPAAVVERMDPDGKASGALFDSGRWVHGDGSVVVHDYLEWQPSAEKVRSKRQKETERWRRRADSAATPRGDDEDSDAVPPATQPQPQPSASAEGAAPTRRGKTAIPKQFVVTDEMKAWAAKEYPTLDWDRETRKFVAWAKAKDVRYANWEQAWRNWMHRAADPQRFAR